MKASTLRGIAVRNRVCIAALVYAVVLGTAVCSVRAATVASNTSGTLFNNSTSYIGQSFTTVSPTAVDNITFNYFSNVPASLPFASGTGFLLSTVYSSTPAGLSSATPGFLGQAVAAGGFYSFASGLTLSPNTQYFFYTNVPISANTISGGNVYAGGVSYFADPNYRRDFDSLSANFRVTGSPVADEGTPALMLGLGILGLAGLRGWRLRLSPGLIRPSR